jgi:hypothetical protein
VPAAINASTAVDYLKRKGQSLPLADQLAAEGTKLRLERTMAVAEAEKDHRTVLNGTTPDTMHCYAK